ncbi:unnamed protein product [Spirodela intermedia]|uniref:Uncharacterized protein n=1 Tax=Spirodela intermedia TaxID=51605 RepID=A0A7I8JJQ9_SPIIN|nr:unnamed protein product [Spirodela intermedia]CAA6670384.1 unnamed protein product [Spirodela intermedia]
MVEGPKLAGIMSGGGGGNFHGRKLYDLAFYQKLGDGSTMSVDSIGSLETSTVGGSVAMSVDNSSVGSNDSQTLFLNQLGLRPMPTNINSVGYSILRPTRALMDDRFPTQGLAEYDEWTIDLRKLNLGAPIAQGAFGKLYKGAYNGETLKMMGDLMSRSMDDVSKNCAVGVKMR